MNSNKEFVILLEIFVITFLVLSVVSVCGLSDSSADIYAYPSIVNPGDEITVTYSGAPGFVLDWIAMYKVSDPKGGEYYGWQYLAGEKSGTLIFTAPNEPGDYEFQLFESVDFTDIARSNVVRVQAGTTVPTPTPTTLSGVHHLGDRTLSDWEVPKPEGTEYTTTFSLTAVPASADLILDVFDTDYNNPVLVNGNSVGILCINTIKSWKQCTIKIPGYALRVGSNTLTIQSESRGEDYDDFMIRNIGVTPSSDAQPTTLPHTTDAELAAYYPFDGDIRDYSGNGNDGAIHGATFVSGIRGQALSFDGKDDHVSAPVDINPTVIPQMTITAWVRADNDSGTIVSHDDGGFDRTIDIDTRGGGKGWSAFSGSGVVGYSPVTIGEWVFLAAVYDQSAETVKLYVNGTLISEEKGKLGSGWDYINIGKNPSCGDYFSGTVDEVMIYNYDLTKSEVKSIYEGGEAPEEEESGYGNIKVTYISREEVQEKYTVSYDETFKYDDDGDGANEATLYYKGENNLVMSSDDTDKDGKVDLIFHYDDEEYLTRAIRDTDGDGEFDQILHFNRDEEIIKVEKIRSDDTRNFILFIILGSIIFFLVLCFWLYVTKKQSYNSKMNELNYMGRINHQLGRRLILILISFLIIFALFVPPVSSLEDVIDDDCNIIQDVFDRDWKKYSDLEMPYTFEEFPLTARSWETQQYYAAQSKIVDAEVQIFFLKRDMEIDRLIRLELKKYEKALKDGHRKNLLKSFARLSFLTVQTVYEAYGAGKSVGESYVNLFTTPSSVSAAGSVLKITKTYNAMVPPDSTALAKNTQSITKSVDEVSKNVAYEALESLGDPTKVGTELVKQVINAVPVSHKAKDWKLTDDDFNILREEHLEMKRIGKIIAKSYKVNLERQDKVRELEAQIKELEKELAEWEANEKNRVKAVLVDSCKDEKKEKCDSEHLSLCDNENDCKTAGGYWYINNCNDEPKEEDTSDGEFNCPIPIPKEASHIVRDRSEYWLTPNGFVGPYYTWFDMEKTKKHRFDCYNIEGERHGLAKMWYEDGTPQYEWNYKDGKLHGVIKWWYKDGTLHTETNYKDGKKHGVYKWWREDGSPQCEWNYKDGKFHGVIKWWYYKGTLHTETNYKDGKKHGVDKEWREDGTPFTERNYKDGKFHGVYKRWYEDGTPEYEWNYKDGKKHGVYKWWREDGTPFTEQNYKDGKLHGVYKWWADDGTLIRECNYEEGKCVSCVHGHC